MNSTGFAIGDRVGTADPFVLFPFLGTVVGFENVVVRAGDDRGTIAVLTTGPNGEDRDYYVEQLVIVKGDGGWTNSMHPSLLAHVS